MAYSCKTCGAVADAAGDLCSPCDKTLFFNCCDLPKIDNRYPCQDTLDTMEFTCTACGRIAKEKSHLCNPAPVTT